MVFNMLFTETNNKIACVWQNKMCTYLFAFIYCIVTQLYRAKKIVYHIVSLE